MGRYEKLYRNIKNNPKTLVSKKLTVYWQMPEDFKRRNKSGSHFIYSHPDLKEIDDYVNIPYKRPNIKSCYIKRAIEKFELANPDFVKRVNEE